MFVDAYNTFSRNQEVTAEAYSDNVIDTGNLGIGDTDISLFIKVNTSVSGGNMTFALESSDTEDFAEVVVEHITKTFLQTSLLPDHLRYFLDYLILTGVI